MHKLPEPSADALASSLELTRRIRAEIDVQGGWIPFSRYMELALYAPGLGYYAGGSRKFGEAGDFVTAPELTPLFADALAGQLAELLPQTGGELIEFGAGTGRLAADLLAALQRRDVLPTRYRIVELSAELAQRQRDTIAARVPDLLDRVEWLNELPARIDGVLIGNEVLDAMPCELVRWDEAGLAHRRGVGWRDGFVWQDRDLAPDSVLAREAADIAPGSDYLSEIPLAATAFVASVAEHLARGALILLDYGFPRREFYHPQRRQGTLMCHYRHHAHGEPFSYPGLTDITCHVDFTAVAVAGIEAGLDLTGYTSQASFLINCGIAEALGAIDPNDLAAYLPQAAAVQKLLSPAEMGELFKVIGFGKGVDINWRGFAQGDRSHAL